MLGTRKRAPFRVMDTLPRSSVAVKLPHLVFGSHRSTVHTGELFPYPLQAKRSYHALDFGLFPPSEHWVLGRPR